MLTIIFAFTVLLILMIHLMLHALKSLAGSMSPSLGPPLGPSTMAQFSGAMNVSGPQNEDLSDYFVSATAVS